MKRETIWLIMATILYIISVILIIAWYDWKLLLILFLFVWANNLENKSKKIMALFGSDWIEKPQPEVVEIYVEHPERKYTQKQVDQYMNLLSNYADFYSNHSLKSAFETALQDFKIIFGIK